MKPAKTPGELRSVAFGVLHSPYICAWCGATADLRVTVLGLTRAEAAVCVDVVACVRRQRERTLEEDAA
jgi:hypothetical protein